MKKLISWTMVILFSFSFIGCGGGGGGSSNTNPDPPRGVPQFIKTEGDVVVVPSGVDGLTFKVTVKDYYNTLIGDIRVMISIPALGYEIEGFTNSEGAVFLALPRIDFQIDYALKASLLDYPEVQTHNVVLKYIVDPTIPTFIHLVGDNFTINGEVREIGMGFGETTTVSFEVQNAFGEVLSGVGVEKITGESRIVFTDSSGIASFTFTAGYTPASALMKVRLLNYPANVADVLIYWQEDFTGPVPVKIILLDSYVDSNGDTVVEIPVGEDYPLIFVVEDSSGNPIQGLMMKILYPWGASAITDFNGEVVFTIPSSLWTGYDWDAVWTSIKIGDGLRLDFKIVYFVP
ncbi:MAG: hypothetical protein V1851_01500 [Patescibacteria group bacterium]